MEEILQELIKTTTENGPQKHFYSNLAITEPFQKQVEISTRISKGLSYLKKAFDPKTGFQSQAYKSRNCTELVPTDVKNPPEIYTSLIALHLLGSGDLSEIQLSETLLKPLREFIIPECAISTVNIFKPSFCESESSSDERDSGYTDNFTHNVIPDDCNTTSLVASILFRDGILDYKPAKSIGQFLLTNVPIPETNSSECNDKSHGVIHTFFSSEDANGPDLDPIVCANVLYLYYQTESNLNLKQNVENTELFLLETLKSLLTSCEDKEEKEGFINETALHHSPDALIYFLSRVTAMSQHVSSRFRSLLIALLNKRISRTSLVLDISMRILSASELGLLTDDNSTLRRAISKDYDRLAQLQNNIDGSWPADSLFKIGITGTDVFYGGREVSTMFASKALDVYFKSVKAVKIKTRFYKDFMY